MQLQSKPMSDADIIELYWQRDEQAIKETDIKYKSFLLSVAQNIVHDVRDSEECLNDTYVGAWNAIPPARPTVLQAFLATIMRRFAITRYKANRRHKRVASELTVSLSDLGDMLADEDDVSAEMQAKELAAAISRYVRALPDRQTVIFVGRFYMADPLMKIAQEVGCSLATVKREIATIKDGLKKHLESEGYDL